MKMLHGVSFGAMLLGAAAVGLVSDPLEAARRLNPLAAELVPHPDRAAFYDQFYPLYNQLYQSVEGLYPQLNRLAEAAPDPEEV